MIRKAWLSKREATLLGMAILVPFMGVIGLIGTKVWAAKVPNSCYATVAGTWNPCDYRSPGYCQGCPAGGGACPKGRRTVACAGGGTMNVDFVGGNCDLCDSEK